MCQDTSELKKIQSLLSSGVPKHKWTKKKFLKFKVKYPSNYSINVQVQLRYKCNGLNVNQRQWSLSMVSLVALYQSTINPQVGLNCTKKIERQLFQRTITILELPGTCQYTSTFPNHATLDASQWCIRCNGAH